MGEIKTPNTREELLETIAKLRAADRIPLASLNNWRYILDESGEAVAEPDSERYFEWWVAHPGARRVALDDLGGVSVSTVFLGYDHGWGEGEDPILFETMVYVKNAATGESKFYDGQRRRYSTRAQALEAHAELVAAVRQRLGLVIGEGQNGNAD